MNIIKGFCTFGVVISWVRPSSLMLRIQNDSVVELSNSGRQLPFVLNTKFSSSVDIQKILNACFDGLGFMLDVPIYWSYPMSSDFEALSDQKDTEISFEYTILTLEYDSNEGYYVDKTITVNKTIQHIEMEKFIAKMLSDRRLDEAVFHYLKAIEEPELFLVSLYRAFERIRYVGVIPNKQAHKFGELTNDTPVVGSRHSKDKQNFNVRYLTQEERSFCLETIKTGIIKYADYLSI
jgi:hypothetical protein